MKSPIRIYALETTNYCNASCNWCPHSIMKRKFGLVAPDVVKKVVEYCKEIGQDYIALHHMGEPLMHPRIGKVIRSFADEGIQTEISTNGLKLQKCGPELLASGLNRIRIAVDFGYHMRYYKTFVKEFIGDVYRNNSPMEIRIHSIFGNDLSIFQEINPNVIIEGKDFDNWAGAINGKSELPKEPDCYFLKYNYVVMLWDGSIVPCCMDYEGFTTIGTIDNIRDIPGNNFCSLCSNCAKLQFAVGYPEPK